MIYDNSIKFLENFIVSYYAGLDYKSLPFNKSAKQIYKHPDIHIAYLSALSLVVDYIVLPPSFNLFWSSSNLSKYSRKKLIDLYQSGILISPIYKGMNTGTNFLDYKLSNVPKNERETIMKVYPFLHNLFSEIPVFHRNIKHQSHGFREKVLHEFSGYRDNSAFYSNIIKPFLKPENEEIEISRDRLFLYLAFLLRNKKITKAEYAELYLKINKAYYIQGAQTHESYISLLNTKYFNKFEKSLYIGKSNLLIGYDPNILLSIFNSLGISAKLIYKLSINDILKLREPIHFTPFKKLYNDLSVEMQRITFLSRLNQIDLNKLSNNLISKLEIEYKKESLYIDKFKYNYRLIEALFYLSASTGVGLLISDILSYLIGASGALLLINNTSDKIADTIISRLSYESSSVYKVINLLRSFSDKYYSKLDVK